jgi:hypothetical protein
VHLSQPADATPRPDFFIVGAPKCGTTSLFRYLAGHPDVFTPTVKEPNYFGSDVRAGSGLDLRSYLQLFAGAAGKKAIGEASVWSLRSRDAAREIAAFDPAARIIVMVREPVSQLASIHNHFVARGIEDITDLAQALDAGTERFRRRTVGRPNWPEFLDYRLIPRYTEQLSRYLEVFPREQVHVVVQEELSSATAVVFRDVLRFLGLDESYEPTYERHNVSRRTQHRRFARWLNAPPPILRAISRRLLPLAFRRRIWGQTIRRRLQHATSVPDRPTPVTAQLAAALRVEYGPEVHRLARLIDRPDLPRLWGYPELDAAEPTVAP